MCSHKQNGPDSDATMTLWQRSVAEGSTSEDTIRVSHKTITAALNTAPRPRLLASASGGGDCPDFNLGERLGSGGVGVVYSATQTALGRDVAVKMVKPDHQGSAIAADALMAEAVVTGSLEHPNIVPVYDLGVDAEGNLFYAMKEVQGVPWSQLISKKTQDENLDILLRVTDTISFAHSRGILHRDLKPHNIMLGEFGEVMVMDWGASCHVQDLCGAVDQNAGSTFCGTPAYMPPEMARGDVNRLSEASDIYLLGAILYQIIAGHPPRVEKDPVLCLAQAAENHIEPADEGELCHIALKAMAAAPADRFVSVRHFQRAIQNYRSHSESLRVSENARAHWQQAKKQQDYDLFNRAVFAAREALDLWPQNADAEQIRREVVVDYARCALGNNDLELAQSLLSSSDPSHRELLDCITRAISERDAHKRRHRRLLLTARLLGGGLLFIFAAGFFLVRSEQARTRAEHQESLVNLIAAHYGEQNYEAAEASFWELHDQYGMDGLDEDLLLNVRVAAAMNPSRGAVATGLDQPLGLLSAVESNCVWVVGRRQIKKVRLDLSVGYDPKTIVTIHDLKFGKRRVPGSVVESLSLPAEIISSSAVFEHADGTLWTVAGSQVWRYSRQSEDWEEVLDIRQLTFNPLPAEYGYRSGQSAEFLASMKTFAGTLPATGILTTGDQSKAAVVLGGGVVCWVDLQAKRCLGWFFASMEVEVDEATVERAPVLDLSPDENWLLFREGSTGSFVYTFQLPKFIRCHYYYGRNHIIRNVEFAGNNRFFGMNDWEGRAFAPNIESFSGYNGPFDADEPRWWGPEWHSVRVLPVRHWEIASLNVSVSECAVITSDNQLFAGSLHDQSGPDLLMKVMERDWIDGVIPFAGTFCVLDDSGRLQVYSTHRFAVQSVEQNARCLDVCSSGDSDLFFGLFERDDGHRAILKIGGAESKKATVDVLVPKTDAIQIYGDPSGKFIAATVWDGTRVYDVQSGEELVYLFRDRAKDQSNVIFDEFGEYMAVGGQWSHWLYVYRTSDWKCILAENEKSYLDLEFDCDPEGGRRMLLARSHLFEGRRVAADRTAPSNLLWQVEYSGAVKYIIPYADRQSGERLCWLGGWFDNFWKTDLQGREIKAETNNYWIKKGIRMPVYGRTADEAFFHMEDGQVHMVLKSDLVPVADPRLFGEVISQVAASTDGTMLALVRDGQLELMNLDEVIEPSR